MGNIQENCKGGTLGGPWITWKGVDSCRSEKWQIHRPTKREKASDKHKLIDINANEWAIFKEIASRGPWEDPEALDCRRLAVKGKICHNMGKKWSWGANHRQQFGNKFISSNMQRDPGGVQVLYKDE